VALWRADTGALERTFEASFAAELRHAAINEDSSKVKAVSGSGVVIWNLHTGAVVG